MSVFRVRLALRAVTAVALIALATACGSDSTGPDEGEPDVSAIRLTFGSNAPVTFTGAAGESRSVRVPLGATTVTAQWLRSDGSVDPAATADVFRLQVTAPAGITFVNSSSNAFSGTMTVAAAATNAQVQFGLLHVAENHTDFGPITVNVSAP
jgi:hypothetical protein